MNRSNLKKTYFTAKGAEIAEERILFGRIFLQVPIDIHDREPVIIVLRVENCGALNSNHDAVTRHVPRVAGYPDFSASVLFFPGSRIESGVTLTPHRNL
jgi:hypothetical protein